MHRARVAIAVMHLPALLATQGGIGTLRTHSDLAARRDVVEERMALSAHMPDGRQREACALDSAVFRIVLEDLRGRHKEPLQVSAQPFTESLGADDTGEAICEAPASGVTASRISTLRRLRLDSILNPTSTVCPGSNTTFSDEEIRSRCPANELLIVRVGVIRWSPGTAQAARRVMPAESGDYLRVPVQTSRLSPLGSQTVELEYVIGIRRRRLMLVTHKVMTIGALTAPSGGVSS